MDGKVCMAGEEGVVGLSLAGVQLDADEDGLFWVPPHMVEDAKSHGFHVFEQAAAEAEVEVETKQPAQRRSRK